MEDHNYFLDQLKIGVCVNEYFPNLKQFVEKAKCLMTEGCFTNNKVYRLKKIVRKLINERNDEESKV